MRLDSLPGGFSCMMVFGAWSCAQAVSNILVACQVDAVEVGFDKSGFFGGEKREVMKQ